MFQPIETKFIFTFNIFYFEETAKLIGFHTLSLVLQMWDILCFSAIHLQQRKDMLVASVKVSVFLFFFVFRLVYRISFLFLLSSLNSQDTKAQW